MASRVKRSLENWDEWIRPYVVRKIFQRRKNQYDSGMTESYCYSVDRVPFELMVEHRMPKYLKWKVVGKCGRCGNEFDSSWNNIWIRKAYKGLEICGKCGRKEQFTDEWRHNNSEAQKRIQGTQESRKRMSKILKESWDGDPDRKKRLSQSLIRFYEGNDEVRAKIGEASRKNWKRLEYQEKVTGHGYHHGWFISRCGRIYFASSWELMFLIWCDGNSKVSWFKRSMDAIEYEKPCGGKAYYHPDFEIMIDSNVSIIEVKGGRSDFDLIERKRVAAELFYKGKANYSILFKQDLQRMGVFRQNKLVGVWIDGLVAEGKVDYHGFGKKHSQSASQR
jgi:hypothetical protein